MRHEHLLIELHTEELPPKSLHKLATQFCEGISSRLKKADLSFEIARYYATPRRLAVSITRLTDHQPDKMIERKGPALDKAFDAQGDPTPACVGFARSCQIDVKELVTLNTPQGQCVGYHQAVTGKKISEILPALLEETIQALPIPKPMRWGNHTYKFIRPVHSLIILYGDQIIDMTLFGKQAGRKTRGHRFLHSDWLEISHADQYLSTLKTAFVIADFEERQNLIYSSIHSLVKNTLSEKAKAVIEPDLLEEVTSLVEWPYAICGSFDHDFLAVPQQALIASMKDHQRYFPVVDQNNHLLPHFIAISNIESKDPTSIIKGNERVLHARLSDAKFFFDTDSKASLNDYVEKLKTVVFQNKLGTLFDKTQRIKSLSAFIAKKIHANTQETERAAYLAKADLVSQLVGEFPELQGIAGRAYAMKNENAAVATAIEEHYLPRFSGDRLPSTPMGCALAIADRLDTLIGIFGINQAPTGDKDPFALRRAALGVLRILIETPLNLDLRELLNEAVKQYSSPFENTHVVEDTLNFMLDRLKPFYQEKQMHTNIIASVLSLNLSNPYDIDQRIRAVQSFNHLSEAKALSAANKRVKNILDKFDEKISSKKIDSALFESDAEKHLAEKVHEKSIQVTQLSETAQYQTILTQLAELQKPVDDFFDHVMVMTDDTAKRDNRLLLLQQLRSLFLYVADIALLP